MKIEIIRSDENSNRDVVWTLTIDGKKMHEERQLWKKQKKSDLVPHLLLPMEQSNTVI